MQKKNEKAYEKTVWKDRETIISANLLNKIENQLVALDTNVVDLDSQVKNVEHENEKQNFYINALYNENINGRLTIEGEGNSLKLTNSKKGIAEIETVVGNTFVNRVSEPMRELILNGDIDAQGIFVTTNESVDNGLIDVVCEGDTLVNLLKSTNYTSNCIPTSDGFYKVTADGTFKTIYASGNVNLIKPNTEYTFVIFIRNHNSISYFELNSGFLNNQCFSYSACGNLKNGIHLVKLTSLRDLSKAQKIIDARVTPECKNGSFEIKMILLEGDYTNKPIPTEYFEGMKSVGEQEDGNHKIEIISNNKSLIDWNIENLENHHNSDYNLSIEDNSIKVRSNYQKAYGFKKGFYVQEGEKYTLSIEGKKTDNEYSAMYLGDKTLNYFNKDTVILVPASSHDNVITGTNYSIKTITMVAKKSGFVNRWIIHSSSMNNYYWIRNMFLEKGETVSCVPQKQNKKEILLKEPLRRIPAVTKDRFVKIDGKWFIKRNCKKIVLDGGLTDGLTYSIGNSKIDGMTSIVIRSYTEVLNKVRPSSVKVLTDRLPSDPNIHYNELTRPSLYQWTNNTAFLVGALKTDMLESNNEQGVINWFQKNPTTVIFEGAAPVYEPLEITPELVCYNEVTHISNNSLIPCNMTVKNTGFSCMSLAKNGTYTVTHNGGEGVNSNVDTTDNMVRLYGKSKTVSDVMVLDGRVSQASESFEGMKSTFEDKLVTQEMIDSGLEKAENLGKYKVNITVRSKNLKNLNTVNEDWGGGQFNTTISQNNNYHSCETFDISNLKGETIYGAMFRNGTLYHNYITFACIFDKNKKQIGDRFHIPSTGYQIPLKAHYMRFMNDCGSNNSLEAVKTDKYAIATEPFTAGETYEPCKDYKTSVYLNSPLLKDDEIVLKEDGLYHYHKSTSIRISLDNGFYAADIPREQGVYIQIENKHLEKRFDTSKNHDSKFTCCNKFKTLPNSGLHNFDQEPCIGITSDNFIRLILRYKTMGLTNYNNDSIREWLRDNPIDLIYPLLTPYYEKISNDKLILEISNNATLHIDSIIPCKNIKANYTGNLPSVYKLENDISIIENHNIDIIATTFDMDYRLLELRWMLEDSGIAGIDLLGTLNSSVSKNKTLTRYEQAKIIIIGKAYDKETLIKQLARYLEKEIITKTEYDKLIALMAENE